MQIPARFMVFLSLSVPGILVAGLNAKRVACAQAKEGSLCKLSQEPGFMNSWAGQPSAPDHSESRTVKKGSWMGCWAEAATGAKPAGCLIEYKNGGQVSLPSRTATNAQATDVITLRCQGKSPTCCKLQTTAVLEEIKSVNANILATEAPQIVDATTRRVRNFTATADANGNQHPAVADINANGTIKCTSASGQNPGQYPPACFALGIIFRPPQTIGTGQGGTMTLTCNGQGALRCSVQVVD